jgi:hypothetical protein
MPKANPQPYEYDFDGACAPGQPGAYAHAVSFSLGIFQWIPRASKKGLKRGKVVRRIKGYLRNPEEALGRARAVCEELNRDLREQKVIA